MAVVAPLPLVSHVLLVHFLQVIQEAERVLVPVIEEHDGFLLKVEGDSMLIIFRRPTRAEATDNAEEFHPKAGNIFRRKKTKTSVSWSPEPWIKKGESGSIMCNASGDKFILPAYPATDVKDPTGAGDSFAGGFMGCLAQNGKADFETLKKARSAPRKKPSARRLKKPGPRKK